MDALFEFAARVSLAAVPLYLCNSMALIFGGRTPIDLEKNFFDGRRILGAGKTFRGTFAAIVISASAAFMLSVIFPSTRVVLGVDYFNYGFLLAVGAVLGDFAGSFAKRRFSIARGKGVFLLDQLDFVAGGLAVGMLLVKPTVLEVLFLLAFTMLAHVVGNWIAYHTKIKRVPW